MVAINALREACN